MKKEHIFTEIQNIVSANPVLVIGSGASVPYNIPGMNTLSAELKDFLGANPYKNPDSKKAVHEFIENLNHGMGLEKALLNTKATDEVENDIVCNDEDLTYLTFVSHKNGDGVHILCRSYSRKEQLWLSPLFCCLQGKKLLII